MSAFSLSILNSNGQGERTAVCYYISFFFFFQFIDVTDGYPGSVLSKELLVLMEMFWSRAI